ncbi:MAG: 3-deoxy-D-manno-octulosonic acid transferase [Candidatus Rokuibacteriota bacterium]|nr:MAG: 3-deoxy-D-manno-octulosonic acid transferase [Candidatus Rokubacteria bacterium]
MIHRLYTVSLGGVVAAYAPMALYRRFRRGVPLHLRARLGFGAARAASPTAWVHAVSVGETIAALPLIEGIRRLAPALPPVVTTVTDTGARVVSERLGDRVIHRFFPLDFPGAVRRALDAINPAFLVCMETEIWPNMLRVLAQRRVPVMIANGRVSDRSFRRYRLVRPLLRHVLDHVTVFAMRSEEDAQRMIALGARPERVFVTGNIKHEPLPEAGGVELWQRLLGLAPEQRVWIAGSTHHGEEAAVLDAHAAACRAWPDLVLVLAPRHPERVGEVVALVGARGWPVVKRSELPRERQRGAVIVLDTVGELAPLYGIADVVFVGGSLVVAGGHNMLEPAQRRKPVLFGPHTANFKEAAALLVQGGGGIVVRDTAALATELSRLLGDPALRAKIGGLAHEAVAGRHGAVKATLDLVERFLLPAGAS